jgi:murein DD-endopeptidase MepM/ murein hydrolase activator NlpD/photosystem II stability/assembly factor-like uncharacterized protein
VRAGDGDAEAGAIVRAQRLPDRNGVVLTDRALLVTRDGGVSFEDISPPASLEGISDAFFVDAERGYLAGWQAGAPDHLRLAWTKDGGRSWQDGVVSESRLAGGARYASAQVQFLDADEGFLLGQRATSAAFSVGELLHTRDGGTSWVRLPAPPAAGRFVFADSVRGFLTDAPVSQTLYRTLDGGRTWRELRLGLDAQPGEALFALPRFRTPEHGTLAVTVRGARPRLLSFITDDGGRRWRSAASVHLPADTAHGLVPAAVRSDGELVGYGARGTLYLEPNGPARRLAVPAADLGASREETRATTAPGADVLELDLGDDGDGWALVGEGACGATGCRQSTRLLALEALDVSQAQARTLLTRASSALVPARPLAAESSTRAAAVSSDLGFDQCVAGSVSQMQAWRTYSPFRDANVYLGGVSRGCAQPNLTPSWVGSVFEQGWRLIPTWVGPQAPCTSYRNRIAADAATARHQGVAEADQAASAAAALGLGPGSPIYYDLEAYSGGGACSDAVRAFVDAWTLRLNERGYVSGLYGLPRSAQEDWRSGVVAHPPDAVWLAYYACTGTSCGWTPRTLDIPGLDDAYWPRQQRIVQYWSSHTETWGGVSFTIDRNTADGPVATPVQALDADVLDGASDTGASLTPGELRRVRVRVRNTGSSTWQAGDAIRLGAGADNDVAWSGFACGGYAKGVADARAFLCAAVEPGETHDFSFEITAPASGTARLSVGMVKDGVQWFGEPFTWSLPVVAPPLAARVLDSTSLPAAMAPGETRPVVVRVQNTGSAPWTAAELHRLGAAAGGDVAWSGFACGGYARDAADARAYLCQSVAPGEIVEFAFAITAPASGSSARLAVQMVQDGVRWFGAARSFSIPIVSSACAASVPAERWRGEYFPNPSLSGSPVLVRDEGSALALDWGAGSPSAECGLPADGFSSRFTRTLDLAAGHYRFTVSADDGVRLFVDGRLVLDEWRDQVATFTTDLTLGAGLHRLSVEHYENQGGAQIAIGWRAFEPAAGWSFPVGSADSGAGWRVTLGLGQSWVSASGLAYRGHLAEDWFRNGGSSLGQPVYAAADGEVVTVVQNCGNYVDVVVLRHDVPELGEPVYTMYGHVETTLRLGDRVRRRDPIGVLGNPATFSPHLHFEIKNHTALVNQPFSSCANVARQVYVSAGYSGRANDYAGGDYYDPSDAVAGNRYYHPTRFIQRRLLDASAPTAAARAPRAVSAASAGPLE